MRQRLRNDRGQTIFLAPIGFIIVLLLGGVVLEAGNLHLRQRQLDDLADSVASNAAGAGFDVDHFRSTDGEIRVNIDDAINAVNATIINSNFETGSVGQMLQAVGGDNPGDNGGIEVTLTYTHDFIFGQQVFGVSQQLTATGNATLRTSDDPPAPGPP